MAYVYNAATQYMLLVFLVLVVNSNWFQILRSCTFLLKPPVFMHSCKRKQHWRLGDQDYIGVHSVNVLWCGLWTGMVVRVSSCVPTTDYATDGSHSHQHNSHHVTDGSHWYVQCYYCWFIVSQVVPHPQSHMLCDIVVVNSHWWVKLYWRVYLCLFISWVYMKPHARQTIGLLCRKNYLCKYVA